MDFFPLWNSLVVTILLWPFFAISIAVLLWPFFAILIAVWAYKWNRSIIGYALLAFVLSPLIAGIVLLIVGEYGTPCPHCGGKTVKGATVCKNCGRDTEPESLSSNYPHRF